MKNLKKTVFIFGIIVFFIVAGLAWNYIETIKVKNDIERDRLTEEKRLHDAEMLKQANFQAAYIECIEDAQAEYDARAAQGPIFGDGPFKQMESKKQDCERLYGIK